MAVTENKIDKRLERKQKDDYKKKRQREQEDKFDDLPRHLLNKLYK